MPGQRVELALEQLHARLEPLHFVVHCDELLLARCRKRVELVGGGGEQAIAHEQRLRVRLRRVQAQIDGGLHGAAHRSRTGRQAIFRGVREYM